MSAGVSEPLSFYRSAGTWCPQRLTEHPERFRGNHSFRKRLLFFRYGGRVPLGRSILARGGTPPCDKVWIDLRGSVSLVISLYDLLRLSRRSLNIRSKIAHNRNGASDVSQLFQAGIRRCDHCGKPYEPSRDGADGEISPQRFLRSDARALRRLQRGIRQILEGEDRRNRHDQASRMAGPASKRAR